MMLLIISTHAYESGLRCEYFLLSGTAQETLLIWILH